MHQCSSEKLPSVKCSELAFLFYQSRALFSTRASLHLFYSKSFSRVNRVGNIYAWFHSQQDRKKCRLPCWAVESKLSVQAKNTWWRSLRSIRESSAMNGHPLVLFTTLLMATSQSVTVSGNPTHSHECRPAFNRSRSPLASCSAAFPECNVAIMLDHFERYSI